MIDHYVPMHSTNYQIKKSTIQKIKPMPNKNNTFKITPAKQALAESAKPTVASSAAAFGGELQKYYPKSSLEREQFVLNSIFKFVTSDQIASTMKPISVDGPNNTQITIKVMPDYVMLGGTRVPMSATTAKQVAARFGFKVPDANISKLVHQKADVQVAAKPLSGTGAVVDGKQYSGKEVVQKGVDYAGFVQQYNEKVNQELADKNVKPGQIVSGFAKDIVTLPGEKDKKNLGLHGFYDEKGRAFGAASDVGGTSHDTTMHSEYGAFLRLVSGDVEVTDASGNKRKVPADQLSNLLSGKKVEVTPPPGQQKPTDTPTQPAPAVSKPKPSAGPVASAKPAAPASPGAAAPASKGKDYEMIEKFLESFGSRIEERKSHIVTRVSLLEKCS